MYGKIISGFKSRSNLETGGIQFSIGITTFEARFEKYFLPLLERIRQLDQDTEVIVAINGEHKKSFDESFRKKILESIAEKEKVFPIMFPGFRGLAKLWNTLLIHSSHENVLVLNDDVMIENARALDRVQKELEKNKGRSFVINESWSHFVISKSELDKVGYFDERLLGIGEEDGDFCWRYIELFGKPVAKASIPGFKNYAQETMVEKPLNIESRPGMKYSAFNRRFIEDKYSEDPRGHRGMFDKPVKVKDPGEKQYPYESFYLKNRDKL